MAYRLIDGSIFLHNPRTGGGTVHAVLKKLGYITGAIGNKHDCPGVVPMDMEVPHYVFVRDPYEWIRSVFAIQAAWGWPTYPKENRPGRWWHPFREINNPPENARQHFGMFLAWMASEHPGWCSRIFTKFADWPNSVVFHTETLIYDLGDLITRIGGNPERIDGALSTMRAKETHQFDLPPDANDAIIRIWRRHEIVAHERFGYATT